MKGPVNRKLRLFVFDINRSVAAPEFDAGRLRAAVPNPRAMEQYRSSVGNLVQGPHGQNN